MTPAQWDTIDDRLLTQAGTANLREHLRYRGWQVTLLELDQERRRRGLRRGPGRR